MRFSWMRAGECASQLLSTPFDNAAVCRRKRENGVAAVRRLVTDGRPQQAKGADDTTFLPLLWATFWGANYTAVREMSKCSCLVSGIIVYMTKLSPSMDAFSKDKVRWCMAKRQRQAN